MQEQIQEIWQQVAAYALTWGLNVLGAIAILVAGWIVAGWARKTVSGALERSTRLDATFRAPIAHGVRYLILTLVVVAVLGQFGVQTASLLAVVGAAGLAIGLALQGTLSNVAAGFMLLILRPFRAGEYIDAQGVAGTVNEIGLFTTQLTTFDGVYVSAPNSQLWNKAITNYSRLPTRRVDLVVGIAYEDDVDKALAALADELAKDERVLAEPASQVMVKGLGASSVDLNMRCWTQASNYWPLLFDLTRRAKLRMDAEGITIAYPQRDIHIKEGQPAAGTSVRARPRRGAAKTSAA